MHLHITTILFIIFEHIIKIFTQGIPISPCPKMFQYRFDGSEWFGILSVRNPDFGQSLNLRVTLSMRGKPATNYLGEIELLTRGQFLSDTPVLYKIKFPKSHFPPKLLQVTTNNHVVCLGAADHSIFVTHIQLEHTRKFTFVADDMALPAPSTATKTADHKELSLLPTNTAFGTKSLPLPNFEMNPMRTTKDICGTIDDRIRFQIFHDSKKSISSSSPTSLSSLSASTLTSSFLLNKKKNIHLKGNFNLHAAGVAAPRHSDDDDDVDVDDDEFNDGGNGASTPLVTDADDGPDGAQSTPAMFSDDGSTTIDELPSITRGAWPWLAAIYVNNLTSLAYHCGGTLVSARIVISSAHCFHLFKQRYTSNEVLVFLGRHNLKNWNEEGSLAAPVEDIFIHPDYDSHLNTYDADIAVVVLKNDVRFNTFIRPACMWSGSTKAQYIEGELGVVVGWGLGNMNVTSALSHQNTIPKVINAPIVSNSVCFKENSKFISLSSNRTFCAGVVAPRRPKPSHTNKGNLHILTTAGQTHRLQSGPCNGDSGAGLMIFRNNRWVLRGTVSASLPTTSSGGGSSSRSNCNVNQYVVYSDVAKFLDWIFAFII